MLRRHVELTAVSLATFTFVPAMSKVRISPAAISLAFPIGTNIALTFLILTWCATSSAANGPILCSPAVAIF